jgi:hypothetical protein
MSIITPPNLLPFSFFSHFGHHSLFLLQGEKKKGRKAHETFPLLASRGAKRYEMGAFSFRQNLSVSFAILNLFCLVYF